MLYKVGNEITVTYMTAKATTGLTVTMNVYDEAGVLDAGQSGAMTEIGTTGRYEKSFTPDAAGYWRALIDDNKDGHQVISYRVDEIDLTDVASPPAVA